jgi:hypothetical protein
VARQERAAGLFVLVAIGIIVALAVFLSIW